MTAIDPSDVATLRMLVSHSVRSPIIHAVTYGWPFVACHDTGYGAECHGGECPCRGRARQPEPPGSPGGKTPGARSWFSHGCVPMGARQRRETASILSAGYRR